MEEIKNLSKQLKSKIDALNVLSSKYKKYLIDNNILIYAFRYALHQHTYSVSEVAETIKNVWDDLSELQKVNIIMEIRKALKSDEFKNPLMQIDAEIWEGILKLPISLIRI